VLDKIYQQTVSTITQKTTTQTVAAITPAVQSNQTPSINMTDDYAQTVKDINLYYYESLMTFIETQLTGNKELTQDNYKNLLAQLENAKTVITGGLGNDYDVRTLVERLDRNALKVQENYNRLYNSQNAAQYPDDPIPQAQPTITKSIQDASGNTNTNVLGQAQNAYGAAGVISVNSQNINNFANIIQDATVSAVNNSLQSHIKYVTPIATPPPVTSAQQSTINTVPDDDTDNNILVDDGDGSVMRSYASIIKNNTPTTPYAPLNKYAPVQQPPVSSTTKPTTGRETTVNTDKNYRYTTKVYDAKQLAEKRRILKKEAEDNQAKKDAKFKHKDKDVDDPMTGHGVRHRHISQIIDDHKKKLDKEKNDLKEHYEKRLNMIKEYRPSHISEIIKKLKNHKQSMKENSYGGGVKLACSICNK
jgi:hypothetical protein